MRTVLGLAVAALVVLVIALATGSTLAAVLVVMLALAGIVLLLRDWRADGDAASEESAAPDAESITADEFSPDIAGPDKF